MLPMFSDALSAVRSANSQQRRRMSLPLERLVHRKLAEQRGGHRIGLIALPGFGQERPLDLRGVSVT